ncbi:recombinase family protein [Actinopolymorpha sp. B9G3]|uniref:recombinase family protein n=1 Tax=Actinopolymorpha sp. B9G3 TaxID=3158970 RepID=UPI0032D959E3
MAALLIGYARVSTEEQDLTAQRNALIELGVDQTRIYVDHGLTGTNRDRPGLREALAACRAGDTLTVTKLDRLARSLPDARAIAEDLTRRQVKLSLGRSVYDPTDPVGRLLFNVLAMVAEFEADLIRARTREGMRVAKAKGHLRGKQPKLNPRQEAHLVELLGSGEYTIAEVGDLFGVARATVYRAVQRHRTASVTVPNPPTAAAGRHRAPGAPGPAPQPKPDPTHRPRHLARDDSNRTGPS